MFENKTDEQLIAEAKGLYDVIYVVDCYGVSDIARLDRITNELEKRGYKQITSIVFVKNDEDEDEDEDKKE